MNTEEFNKIKINDIINQYNQWNKLVDEGASIDEIKKHILYFITECSFETVKTVQGKFFRARKNNRKELFYNVSQLKYPPEKYVNELGRANRIHKSIMYLGENLRTSLFEVGLEKNDFITVSEWNIQSNQDLNLMYLASSENINHPSLKRIIEGRNIRLSSLNYNLQGIENVNMIHRLLNEEFLKEEKIFNKRLYILSNAIAETLLSYEGCDGFLYSSVRSKNDLNIALKPASSDRALKLDKCYVFKIKDCDDENISFQHLLSSKTINELGEIEWTDEINKID